ncbi:9386_t:CDS:2 [Scutellospora calospora]|uniref:9386_t:CDS:1 n=1 Tax=Scutellospora calospora TaxID=85575 RepID=A0ACA9L746_9GLOM|nr:9386_t:CDS:2 [Scutellospora calospora]
MLNLSGDFKFCNKNNVSAVNDADIPRSGSVFSTCILLANKRTLYPGFHEFFFEFVIPGDLPESISSDHVLCEYFLKATLVPRDADELNSLNKVVDIIDIFVERAMLSNDIYILQGLESTRYVGSKKKILDFEFIIPKIISLDTDSLRFHARWDGLRVDNVTFSFVQSECLRALLPETEVEDSNPPTLIDRATKIISGPFRFNLPRNERLKLQCRPMVFQLPMMEPFVHDYDLFGIEIRHHLIISIQVANRRKDVIHFTVPITVESIIPDPKCSPSPCKVCQNSQSALLHFANKIYHGKILDTNKPISSKDSKNISTKKQSYDQPSQNVTSNDNDIKSNEVKSNEEPKETAPRIVPSRSSSIQYSNRNTTIRNSTINSVNDINDHRINNFKSSISTITESDDDDVTDNISSENTGTTTATTATYINSAENAQQAFSKALPKQNNIFVTTPANVVADKFAKFQFMLQQKRSRQKSMITKNPVKYRSSSSASAIKFVPAGLFDFLAMRANANDTTLDTSTLTA